jgi:ketosteroid isomerase-like protein
MENGILETSVALAKALERGDVTFAGELYADDARLLASSEPLEGREEIEAYWRAGVELGLFALAFHARVLELVESGAVEIGRYAASLQGDAAAAAVEHGSYLVLHTQADDGSWRRAVEVFNPDEPVSARHICEEER